MKRVSDMGLNLLAAALSIAVGGAALGDDLGPMPAVNDPAVVDLLSGIDFVPTRGALDEVFGDTAPDDLLALATDEQADPGIRIRAYRALSHYPGAVDTGALSENVVDMSSAVSGPRVVMLRAAMPSLGTVAGGEAVPVLGPRLDHPLRDIRASAARALGATGDEDAAVPLLRQRLSTEAEPQVQLAIADAIRTLTEP